MKEFDELEYKEEAVVTYIFDDNKLLLIEKLRGLGSGKVNVPGGHIEDGETPEQTAIRETKEEVDLDIESPELVGYLYFVFKDGLTMKGHVFKTSKYRGSPKDSAEAIPFWNDIESLPYERMWEDDSIWIPEMLKGRFFRGFFEFDNDTMLNRKIEYYDSIEEFNS